MSYCTEPHKGYANLHSRFLFSRLFSFFYSRHSIFLRFFFCGILLVVSFFRDFFFRLFPSLPAQRRSRLQKIVATYMATHSIKWLYMAIHGNTWQYMAIHGNTWLYMAIHGYTWVYMAIHGYTWLYMGIHGNTWLYMAIHGYTW